jgi:hypothetical protein
MERKNSTNAIVTTYWQYKKMLAQQLRDDLCNDIESKLHPSPKSGVKLRSMPDLGDNDDDDDDVVVDRMAMSPHWLRPPLVRPRAPQSPGIWRPRWYQVFSLIQRLQAKSGQLPHL